MLLTMELVSYISTLSTMLFMVMKCSQLLSSRSMVYNGPVTFDRISPSSVRVNVRFYITLDEVGVMASPPMSDRRSVRPTRRPSVRPADPPASVRISLSEQISETRDFFFFFFTIVYSRNVSIFKYSSGLHVYAFPEITTTLQLFHDKFFSPKLIEVIRSYIRYKVQLGSESLTYYYLLLSCYFVMQCAH